MRNWYLGQKIVCVNIDAIPPTLTPPNEVVKYLNVGHIYEIRDIGNYHYFDGPRLAFKLKDIVCEYKFVNDLGEVLGEGKEYMFWERRFRPLDEIENFEKLIKSVDKWIDPILEEENIEEDQFKKLKPIKTPKREKVHVPSFFIEKLYERYPIIIK